MTTGLTVKLGFVSHEDGGGRWLDVAAGKSEVAVAAGNSEVAVATGKSEVAVAVGGGCSYSASGSIA